MNELKSKLINLVVDFHEVRSNVIRVGDVYLTYDGWFYMVGSQKTTDMDVAIDWILGDELCVK